MYKIINKRKLLTVRLIDTIGGFLFLCISAVKKLFIQSPPPCKEPENIVIVRFAYIGDLVLTLPVLPELRKSYPLAKITLLTSEKTAPLVRNNPNVDEVMVYNAPWLYGKINLAAIINYMRLIKRVRQKRFSTGIDMRSDIRNIFFILFLGKVKRRIAFEFGGGKYLLTDAVPYSRLMHKVDQHLHLIRYLGTRSRSPHFDFHITKRERENANKLLKQFSDPQRPYFFAIHPGARVFLKRWDINKYSELTTKLIDNYPCTIVLLGEETDDQNPDPILHNYNNFVHSLVGKLDLRMLIAIIEQCSLLISNDSAPMHIGVAVNTPTVTIFGPSKSMETGPYSFGHRVVEKNFICRFTCDETHCLQHEFKACLNAISVSDVFNAVTDLIDQHKIIKDVA